MRITNAVAAAAMASAGFLGSGFADTLAPSAGVDAITSTGAGPVHRRGHFKRNARKQIALAQKRRNRRRSA